MRFYSTLLLGLGLCSALTTAKAPARDEDLAALKEGDLGPTFVVSAGDAATTDFAIRGRNPGSKPPPKKPATEPDAGKKGKPADSKDKNTPDPPKPKEPSSKASEAPPPKDLKAPSSKDAKTISSKLPGSTAANAKSVPSQPTQSKTVNTLSKPTSLVKTTLHGPSTLTPSKTTSTATTTGTKSTASAISSHVSGKRRVKCGEKGSACTSSTCKIGSNRNPRQAISERAWIDSNGNPQVLVDDEDHNKDLSDPSVREIWIPFGNSPGSVTIMGLEGCTAVIAISERGMYAFHLWEDGQGDTLLARKYKRTMDRVANKLRSKREELAGGELYLMIPQNPDTDPDRDLLYDTERWSDDLRDSQSDPRLDPEWTKLVPRSDYIRNAITTGSGLTISREIRYLPPSEEHPVPESWMTAQYDPQAGNRRRAFAVWSSKDGQVAPPHRW